MARLLRLVVVLGAVLVLTGGATAAFGVYQGATSECGSGTKLMVSHLGPDESTGTIAFEDLSPEERRIFLDALRDENNMTDRGNSTSALLQDDRIIAYRGVLYHVDEVVVDCRVPFGSQLEVGGTALVLIGGGILVPSIVWQHSRKLRTLLP